MCVWGDVCANTFVAQPHLWPVLAHVAYVSRVLRHQHDQAGVQVDGGLGGAGGGRLQGGLGAVGELNDEAVGLVVVDAHLSVCVCVHLYVCVRLYAGVRVLKGVHRG